MSNANSEQNECTKILDPAAKVCPNIEVCQITI